MLPKSKIGKLLRREVRDDEKRRMAKEKQKRFTKERRAGMDLFVAIQERRSCRAFVDEPIPDDIIGQILESAVWAPSPANAQPWEFTVVTSPEKRKEIHAEGERCRQWAIGASGWKWLEKYSLDFLSQAPVIIAVTGNPKKPVWICSRKRGPSDISMHVLRQSRTCCYPPMRWAWEVCGLRCLTRHRCE